MPFIQNIERSKGDEDMNVDFKFDIDQRVITPFGDEGLVSMAAIDGEGQQYHVKTKRNSEWFKEDQLTLSRS